MSEGTPPPFCTPEGGWFAAWETADRDRQALQARVAELQIANADLTATTRRYRKALVWIRSKLSCTLVPRNKWVRELHGQIWMVCQTELEPD